MADEAAAEWALVGASEARCENSSRPSRVALGLVRANHCDVGGGRRMDDVPLRYPRPYAAEVANAARENHRPSGTDFPAA